MPRELDGYVVHQRRTDGYVNATALCRAAGRLFSDYRRLASTTEFLGECSATMGIPIVELIQSKEGNPSVGGGTWVHPEVAIDLAYWCSVRFRFQVVQWVRELMTTGTVTINPSPPPPNGAELATCDPNGHSRPRRRAGRTRA